MIWIAGLIVLGLLFAFPKQMGGLIGIVVLAISGFFGYMYIDEKNQKKQRELVLVTVSVNDKNCSNTHPLFVSIKNSSKKTVNKVVWNFAAYKPGYSSNVVNYEYGSEYNSPYYSDKILKPSHSHFVCYSYPKVPVNLIAGDLEWRIIQKRATFAR